MTADKIAIAQGQLECLEALKPKPQEPEAEDSLAAAPVVEPGSQAEAAEEVAAPPEE